MKRLSDCTDTGFLTNETRLQTPQFQQRIAITSFPGSGNTWFRHLFQVSTGIYTGSVYDDRVLMRHGYKGELM